MGSSMRATNYRYKHSRKTQDYLAGAVKYNNWIADMVRPYLGRSVLDIGCATGNITRKFIPYTERIECIDIEPEYIHFIQTKFPFIRAHLCDISSPGGIPEDIKPVETVVCLNVLEHVKNDSWVLDHIKDIILSGGIVCIIVPAHKFLYGTMDKRDGHFRRYDRGKLTKLLIKKGFKIIDSYYFNPIGTIGWFLYGRVLRKEYIPYGSDLDFFDRYLVPFQRKMHKHFRPFFGQSLFVSAIL